MGKYPLWGGGFALLVGCAPCFGGRFLAAGRHSSSVSPDGEPPSPRGKGLPQERYRVDAGKWRLLTHRRTHWLAALPPRLWEMGKKKPGRVSWNCGNYSLTRFAGCDTMIIHTVILCPILDSHSDMVILPQDGAAVK